MHRARAEIDLDAFENNVGLVRAHVSPALLCAVVKADAYGHGAISCAHAAVRAGADWLAVATVEEAAELRAARVGCPILLLAEPRPNEVATAVAMGCRMVVWSKDSVDRIDAAASRAGTRVALHMKVDTGMHRLGVEPEGALALARAIVDATNVDLEGLMTHLPVADEPDNAFTAYQIERFVAIRDDLRMAGIDPEIVHCANSAGAIVHPEARMDMVRCGITTYGIAPSPILAGRLPIHPVMRLTSTVIAVREVSAGEGVSYGHHFVADEPTTIATVPVGYADGVPRRFGIEGGKVLIGGALRPVVGAVTMDHLMVDCGGISVSTGDEVVLIGTQGDRTVDAWDWAEALGTIAYEVVTRIGPRVPRVHIRAEPEL